MRDYSGRALTLSARDRIMWNTHSAANVGHIDVNVIVDKISERLFWKGFNPLGERDRNMWNMHSAADAGHSEIYGIC